MALDFDRLISVCVDGNASDIVLKTGAQPAIKRLGRILFISDDPVTAEDMEAVFQAIASQADRDHFDRQGEVDFAFQHASQGRFRVNLFRAGGQISAVMRQIKSIIPSFQELSLPERQFCHLGQLERGLVFITGITGSGKSTSLAAVIDYINGTRNKHILTLEDPIEYRFEDGLSIINQRQVGNDTRTWLTGLRSAMREAPDVIMLGEIRDRETMEAAIAAAETGHLVLSTLHTVNAVQTVERVMTFFPPHQHDLIRLQLSMVLEGVVSQRLVPCVKEDRMVPAVEILMGSPRIREILKTGSTPDLPHALEEGADYYGTQTFNMSLKSLHDAGLITIEEACGASDAPDDLRLAIRGIVRGSGVRIMGRS